MQCPQFTFLWYVTKIADEIYQQILSQFDLSKNLQKNFNEAIKTNDQSINL